MASLGKLFFRLSVSTSGSKDRQPLYLKCAPLRFKQILDAILVTRRNSTTFGVLLMFYQTFFQYQISTTPRPFASTLPFQLLTADEGV